MIIEYDNDKINVKSNLYHRKMKYHNTLSQRIQSFLHQRNTMALQHPLWDFYKNFQPF